METQKKTKIILHAQVVGREKKLVYNNYVRITILNVIKYIIIATSITLLKQTNRKQLFDI